VVFTFHPLSSWDACGPSLKLVAMGMSGISGPPLLALLGPTNTGKTHLAIDTMGEHDDGVIGLPLRLLERT